MSSRANPYCHALGIQVPRLEVAKSSPDANYYSLLIVALLERGEPITLEEAAKRLEEAGVAAPGHALASLKRCKPARPPIYRDGDRYALDPHDHEADLWAFRLGLSPPHTPALRLVRPDPPPLPSADEPLTVAALDEAWREGMSTAWSAQRIAICVLDAHGKPMQPDEVRAFVRARSGQNLLSADSGLYWRRGSPLRLRHDGLWELDIGHDAVRSARQAVRERIETVRRWAHVRPDPAFIEANVEQLERQRRANAERLAGMRRVLIHAFPAREPQAVVLVDVGRREITTFMGEEITRAKAKLADYDIIAAVEVRALLRALQFEPGRATPGRAGAATEDQAAQRARPHPQDHHHPARSRLVRHQSSLRRREGATHLSARRGVHQAASQARGGRQVPLRALPVRASPRSRSTPVGVPRRKAPCTVGPSR